MAFFRRYKTSNPAFHYNYWKKPRSFTRDRMSLAGIISKSLIMLFLVGITATYTWKLFFEGVNIKWYTIGGMFAAIVFSLFISFKRDWAKYLVPFYSLAKGFFLGGISAYAHKRFPDLPFQAIGVTLITFFVMFLLFKFRIIKVTQKFKSVIITATISIFMVYFIAWIFYFLEVDIPFVWGTSWFAIGFNVLAAIVASLSLLLDFDYIDRQLGRASKEKEWLATWGLMITLIWLYVETLRLMRKLAIRF